MTHRNNYFRYSCDADSFYDFGITLGALFRVFDALEAHRQDAVRAHPSTPVRIMTAMVGLNEYLQKFRPKEASDLYLACCKGTAEAVRMMTHSKDRPTDELSTVLETMSHLLAIEGTNVRALQLRPGVGPTSVFTGRNA